MFFLQCEHLFTPSNFTLAARLFATSEGMLYSLYDGFFRTDVPSSHYTRLLPSHWVASTASWASHNADLCALPERLALPLVRYSLLKKLLKQLGMRIPGKRGQGVTVREKQRI
jgi:hypothetical protein